MARYLDKVVEHRAVRIRDNQMAALAGAAWLNDNPNADKWQNESYEVFLKKVKVYKGLNVLQCLDAGHLVYFWTAKNPHGHEHIEDVMLQ